MNTLSNNKTFALFVTKECFLSKSKFFEELRNRRFNTANLLIWRMLYEKKNTNIVCVRPEF